MMSEWPVGLREATERWQFRLTAIFVIDLSALQGGESVCHRECKSTTAAVDPSYLYDDHRPLCRRPASIG